MIPGSEPAPTSVENIYALDKVAYNDNIIYKSRIFGSLVFGILAGVFGFTSLMGVAIYILSSLVISIFLCTTLPNVRKFLR